MEWDQSLFVWFMLAVVGGILYMQCQLHRIEKKIPPKEDSWNARGERPLDRLRRMEAYRSETLQHEDLHGIQDPTERPTRGGNDETPPVS